jgi:hypothetical protein
MFSIGFSRLRILSPLIILCRCGGNVANQRGKCVAFRQEWLVNEYTRRKSPKNATSDKTLTFCQVSDTFAFYDKENKLMNRARYAYVRGHSGSMGDEHKNRFL